MSTQDKEPLNPNSLYTIPSRHSGLPLLNHY